MNISSILKNSRQDIVFGARFLARRPLVSLSVIAALGLGLAVNLTIFTFAYAVMLNPLPFRDADLLLNLRERNGASDDQGMFVSPGNYTAWKSRLKEFEALGAYSFAGVTLKAHGDPQRIVGIRANPDYWRVLYLPPYLGRYFTSADSASGNVDVIVLSYDLWRSSFARDSSVIGSTVDLDGAPFRIIGVAPAAYAFTPDAPKFWLPLVLAAKNLADHGDHELTVVGKPRGRHSTAALIAKLQTVERELATEYPHAQFDGIVLVTPLREYVIGRAGFWMVLLAVSAALVLLIACVSVANLLYAQTVTRKAELALRMALGASRRRLVAQLLLEFALLGFAALVTGFAISGGLMHAFVALAPQDIPRLHDAALGGPAALFGVMVFFCCIALAGLPPALSATGSSLQLHIRAGGQGSRHSLSVRTRSVLVVCQIGLAFVLVSTAALFLRSGTVLRHLDLGFDSHNLLLISAPLSASRYPRDSDVVVGYEELGRSVAAIPGVASVALISRAPIAASGGDCEVRRDAGTNEPGAVANIRTVSRGYFSALGIPLRSGSDLAAVSGTDLPIVVINEHLAHLLFGSQNPIGRRVITCIGGKPGQPLWRTVVGVAGDTRSDGLVAAIPAEIYLPATQVVSHGLTFIIRTRTAPAALAPAVQRALRTVDPTLVIAKTTTMDDQIASSLRIPTFLMWLITCLAVVGFTLAILGVYGVIGFSVAARLREIGIRMALGATSGGVQRMIVMDALRLTVVGIGLGLIGSLAMARLVAHSLYGVNASDPGVLTVVICVLAASAVLAAFLPSRRAARTPIVRILQ